MKPARHRAEGGSASTGPLGLAPDSRPVPDPQTRPRYPPPSIDCHSHRQRPGNGRRSLRPLRPLSAALPDLPPGASGSRVPPWTHRLDPGLGGGGAERHPRPAEASGFLSGMSGLRAGLPDTCALRQPDGWRPGGALAHPARLAPGPAPSLACATGQYRRGRRARGVGPTLPRARPGTSGVREWSESLAGNQGLAPPGPAIGSAAPNPSGYGGARGNQWPYWPFPRLHRPYRPARGHRGQRPGPAPAGLCGRHAARADLLWWHASP